MQKIIVNKKYNGKKLDKILLDTFSGLNTDLFYKTLRKKDIRINNIRTNKNEVLHTGDEIQIFLTDEFLFRRFIPRIVYEDDNIIIVDKPIQVEILGNNSLTDSLKFFLESRDKDKTNIFVRPCHRLDRNTTGLVLFAKNEPTLNILLNKFRNKEIEKHYLAKVYGIPKSNTQTLTAYLFKDRKRGIVYISDVFQKGYVKIVTSYSILETHKKENYSILDITLHTGKTHQIRAHLAHIGHPILGDGKYGINNINKKFGYKNQQLCSNSLKFNFNTDSGILNYLNGKEIKL